MPVIDKIRRKGLDGKRVLEGPEQLLGPKSGDVKSDFYRLSGFYGDVDYYEITSGSGTSSGTYSFTLSPFAENGFPALHRGVGDVVVFHQVNGIAEPTAPVQCLLRTRPARSDMALNLGPFATAEGDRLWVLVEQRDYSALKYQLEVSAELDNGFAYCTPLYSELPVSYPPYECGTEVNTAGVTDFTDAWKDCEELTEFPCLDTSSGTNFNNAWAYTGLTTIPLLNTSNGVLFNYSFYYAKELTGTFPLWDFSNAQEFKYTWTCWDQGGAPLEFAPGCFDSCTKDGLFFGYSFYGHQLSTESFDNIITSLDTCGSKGGNLFMWDENAYPSQEAIDGPLYNLYKKGWEIWIYQNADYELFPGPEFSCSTEVETAGIENFNNAWASCSSLTSFPELDVSSGLLFYRAWFNCSSLTSFPALDLSSGVNFYSAWSACTSLTSFPVLDLSNGVIFTGAWGGCSSLTSFPELDLSSGVKLTSAWSGCSSLTSFPEIDLSSGVNFSSAWAYCTSLTSFPALDLSSGVIFTGAWYNCSSLTSFPASGLSSGTNFNSAWQNCTSLTSFPELDVSSGLYFNAAWLGCSSLTSFPELDVSSGTNFSFAWSACSSLTSFPTLDLSNGVNFVAAWNNCNSLTSFPEVDVSSGTNFVAAWYGCTSLTSFPTLDLSNGVNFVAAWQNCTSLTSFPELDLSSGTDFNYAWQNCTSLTSFPAGMFDTCTATNFGNAWFNCALDEESVDNILVSLDTAGQSNGTVTISGGTSSAPGTAGAAAKASLIAKGWTVTTN